MKSFLLVAAITIIAAISFPGCRTEPDLANYPTVSFSNDVMLIISSNCNQSGCHDGSGEQSALTTYDEVMAHVKAGDARKSGLYRVITGRGENIMPPSSLTMLTDDQIRTIFVWIEQGAPNN